MPKDSEEEKFNSEPSSAPNSQLHADDVIKVVDRKGIVKMMSRAEYESKKRRRKKRSRSKNTSYREFISIAIILVIMVLAAIIALKIVQ